MSKLYLVTGVSSGIGLAISQNLLSLGHRVVGLARTEKAGIQELSNEYPESFSFLGRDLSDDIDGLYHIPVQLAKQHGKFSGLVHAAGALSVLPNRFNTHEKMLATFNLMYAISLGVHFL